MKRILFILLLLYCGRVSAQNPWDKVFDHYTLYDTKFGNFTIHVSRPSLKTKKPVLIYIDGSGNYPLFYLTNKGTYNTSIAMDMGRYIKDYTIVLISKPNTPFSDSLRYKPSGRSYYPDNDDYDKYYSLDWRAGTASKAIDFVIRKLPVDKKHVIVMGYSEGSQVAPRVAVLNKKVTCVVCFVGNALNQLYDFMIDTRLKALTSQISAYQAQITIDSLYKEYALIYSNPGNTDKKWFGATYLKWSTFSKTTPLENMLKLKIPILYIAGGKDNNQTIIDMDYAKLEFLRKGKSNLTYKVYPNCNHYFQQDTIINNQTVKLEKIDEVHEYAMNWVKAVLNNKKD